MMQPATIALPAQPVPVPQPPIQQMAPAVRPVTLSKPLLPEPPAPIPEPVHLYHHTVGTVAFFKCSGIK